MSIDREFWLRSFGRNRFPYWHCPRCAKGTLLPADNGFRYEETADSRVSNAILYRELLETEGKIYESSENESTISSEFSSYYYSVVLKCNNPVCSEYVMSCGSGHMVEDYELETGGVEYSEILAPEYFYPSLNIFSISPKCPEKVTKEIKSSFKMFFADPPASANYIRKAVEEMLTDRGISRYTFSKGKRIPINLHNRIVEFEKKKPEFAKKLFAVKWLGNEGSHADTISKNDVLDAYEILEFILDDLYVGYRKSVEKKVSKINKIKKALHPST